MGEYTSVSTFYGQEYVEKVVSTGDYEVKTFTPAVYTFDLNPNTGEPINIVRVSRSSELTIFRIPNDDSPARTSFLARSIAHDYRIRIAGHYTLPSGNYDNDIDVRTPESNYYIGVGNDYASDLGCWYDSRSKKLFLIYYKVKATRPSAVLVTRDAAKKVILNLFYNVTPSSYKLTRVSPAEIEFATNQSSQLIYALQTEDGLTADADISISPLGIGSSPGWSFNRTVSPPILTLVSSQYRFHVEVSCEYEGIRHEIVDTFYPVGYTPYGPGGPSKPGGGNGTFWNPESDRVDQDIPPGTDIGDDSSTGMYTRYLMNVQYMKLFGEWMWDPNLGLSLIKTIFESWYGEKQSESLISLLSFPFSLTAPLTGIVSQSQPLYLGHQNILANYIALKSGGAQIDWGTLNLYEYWGNFLDYSPHTKIELYLPWGTGFVDIDPGQCLPGSLRVITNIEFARGSCVHNVVNQDGCVLGTYMGQPGSMVPMIASDIASKRAGALVAGVAAMVGGVVAGGSAAVSAIGQGASVSAYTASMSNLPMTMSAGTRSAIASGIASQPLNVANSIASNLIPGASFAGHLASDAAIASKRNPAHMTRNGGFGDASAGTMIQYPYVIISRPEQNVPDSYGHHYGYPSNIYEPLSTIKGYTEIAAIHLNGIGCSASEMTELERILAGGVIF